MMKIERLKSLDEFSDESELFESRFERLPTGGEGEFERAGLTAEIIRWMQECAEQGRFVPKASAERRAFRSLLERWSSRLREQGRYIEGVDSLADFDPRAGIVLTGDCPYPGLEPYTQSRRGTFFGREVLVSGCVAHLDQQGNRILLIIGASGSGKSSLALAGILPQLAERHDRAWLFGPRLTPGAHPLAELCVAVAQAAKQPDQASALERALTANPSGALSQLAELCQGRPLMLFIDQFEELLTMCRDAKEQGVFAQVLCALSEAGELANDFACRTLLTLRTDHLARFETNSALAQLYTRLVGDNNQHYLSAIGFEDIRRAIKGPADNVGLRFVPATLIDQLASQTAGLSNGLPLLQFALRRLWDTRPKNDAGEPLDLITEEMVKGLPDVERALGAVADGIFQTFSDPQQRICERLMLELVVLDESFEEPLRRRRNEVELAQVLATRFRSPGDVATVIEKFISAGLLRRFGAGSDSRVEVAHEALLRHWDHIYQLLTGAEVKDRLHLVKQIGREAADWATHDKLSDYLNLRGERLTSAIALGGDGWLAEAEAAAYVDACRAQEEAAKHRDKLASEAKWRAEEAEKAREEAELQAKRAQLRLWRLAAIAGLAVLFGVGWAWYREYKESSARELTMAANAELDPARSVHFAVEALGRDPKNERAEVALRQALTTLESAHTEWFYDLGRPIGNARYTKDGSRVVVASEKTVTIFKTEAPPQVERSITRDTNVLKAWLIAENKILVTHTDDGPGHANVQIQRLDESSARSISCEGADDFVYSISVSPNEHWVALGCYNGDVLVLDTTREATKQRPFTHKLKNPVAITALAFSADNQYLASGDANGVVNVWKLGHSDAWIGQGSSGAEESPIVHGAAIRDIDFHPDDPSLLVTAADDSQAIVSQLDLEGRKLISDQKNQWPLKHDRPVIAAKFGRGDLKNTVFTVSDKRVQMWENGIRDWRQMRRHDDWVNDANMSANGALLVTASSDGTARIWSTRSTAPVAVLRGHKGDVMHAAINPIEGHQVMTASADGTVRLWRFRESQLLWSSKKWMLSAAFDPTNGKRVAVAGEDGVRILELNRGSGDSDPASKSLKTTSSADAFFGLSWSRDGKFLAAVSLSHGIGAERETVLWDVGSKQEITPKWPERPRAIVFSTNRDELVTVSKEGQIAVWDTSSLTEAHPSPKLLLGEKSFQRWLAATSPDGRWIAALDGNKVELWERSEPQPVRREVKEHQGDVMSLQFSPNSKWLMTASKDQTARIWPVDASGAEKVLRGHALGVYSASFDANGEWVVTGSADGTIRVWDAKTGNELVALRRHREVVNDVRFSPEGGKILSASDDGAVLLGECEPCALPIEELRRRAHDLAKLPAPRATGEATR